MTSILEPPRSASRRRRVQEVVLRLFLVWVLGGIILAVMVPLSMASAPLREWMVWTVVFATAALSIISGLRNRARPRA